MAEFTASQAATYYAVRAPRISQRGAEWRGPCPLHRGANDEALAIVPSTGEWKCFSGQCGGGDIYRFEELLTGKAFPKAKVFVDELLQLDVQVPAPKTTKATTPDKAKLVAAYDYRDEQGEVLFQVTRWDPKTFKQRRPAPTGRGWVWGLTAATYQPGRGFNPDWYRWRPKHKNERAPEGAIDLPECRLVLYRLPELLAVTPEAGHVFLPEGEKDVDALRGIGLIATCNPMGAGKWRDEFVAFLVGRDVVIIPDADAPGRDHARAIAATLQGRARSVKVLELPEGHKDPADWVLAGGTAEQLLDLVAKAGEAKAFDQVTGEQEPRPEILITTEEMAVNDQAVGALARSKDLYQRGGMLVHLVREEGRPGSKRPTGTPRIVPLPIANLREQMAATALWLRPKVRDGEQINSKTHPPEWSIRAVYGRGQWPGLRYLDGFSESPFIRPDGSVCDEPGYDVQTGRLFLPNCKFPEVPAAPDLAEAKRALELLLEPFADFPFASPAHRAGAIAGLLTLFARGAFHGPTPLFLIDGNVRGAGKGKCVHAASIIFCGREAATQDQAPDNEEERKQITAVALDGDPLVLLDNIARPLGGSALDAALTSTSWSDRVLSTNERPKLPLVTTWFATGNNVQFKGDMTRRVVHIRFESDRERPEERADFRHPNLLDWVTANRGRLAVAAITILRAWFVAGRPDMRLTPWGSFEAWSEIVRNALVWVGMPDPATTRRELESIADPEVTALRLLLEGWEELANEMGIDVGGGRKGITVASAFKLLESQVYSDRFETLRQAISEFAPKNARSFGNKLSHLRSRVVGGKRLFRTDTPREGACWSVVSVCDTNDTSSPTKTENVFPNGGNQVSQVSQNCDTSPLENGGVAEVSHEVSQASSSATVRTSPIVATPTTPLSPLTGEKSDSHACVSRKITHTGGNGVAGVVGVAEGNPTLSLDAAPQSSTPAESDEVVL